MSSTLTVQAVEPALPQPPFVCCDIAAAVATVRLVGTPDKLAVTNGVVGKIGLTLKEIVAPVLAILV